MRTRTRTKRTRTRPAVRKSRAVWDQGVFMGEVWGLHSETVETIKIRGELTRPDHSVDDRTCTIPGAIPPTGGTGDGEG